MLLDKKSYGFCQGYSSFELAYILYNISSFWSSLTDVFIFVDIYMVLPTFKTLRTCTIEANPSLPPFNPTLPKPLHNDLPLKGKSII